MSDFWVFGYGSLIWNPGFEAIETQPALLKGMHRSLCIYSWVHRGTKANPGLVLGLEEGGSCDGMAFRVNTDHEQQVVTYLREREMVTDVYREVWCQIELTTGKSVTALTYIVDKNSPQYSGTLAQDIQIEIVSKASGQSGPNCEYILKTVEHLNAISIRDENLECIAEGVKLLRYNQT